MMKYRFVIFDVDGTLIDSETTGVLSLQKTVRELAHKELSYEEALRCFGISSDKVAAQFDYPDAKAFGRRWVENFQAIAPQYMRIFPGIPQMLRSIKETGSLVGIVTSRNAEEIVCDPLVQSIISSCDVIVSASDTKRRKPDPEPVLCAISKAKALIPDLTAEDCIYCGDTDYDCFAGQGAGCKFALADWKNRGLRGLPADFVFTTADECREIIF